jgi:hypothetical protein
MKNRIIAGFIIAFIGAVIFAFGDLLIPQESLYLEAATKPNEFAHFVTSKNYSIWALRGLFGVFFEMFGVLSIYLALRNTKYECLSFWGLVFYIMHVAIGFGLFSILYFMFPALGKIYLNGTTQAVNHAVMEGTMLITFLGIGALVWLLGILMLSVAIWKENMLLPKWSGLVVTLGILLIMAPGQLSQFSANFIWGLGFLWMAFHYRKAILQ